MDATTFRFVCGLLTGVVVKTLQLREAVRNPKAVTIPLFLRPRYVGSQTPILLQTAKLRLVNPNGENPETSARAILDSGSQRMYVTSHVREKLKLPAIATETIQIKTFGNSESYDKTCDVVSFGVRVKSGETLEIAALVVPLICSPLTSQPITTSGECHKHLLGLELADSADGDDILGVDVLIGSDWYWSLVTGRVI